MLLSEIEREAQGIELSALPSELAVALVEALEGFADCLSVDHRLELRDSIRKHAAECRCYSCCNW
jgi:hypothetical protein